MATDLAATVEAIAARVAHCRQELVFTANVDHVVRFHSDSQFRQAYERATLVVADGMPLVWVGRATGKALPGRVTGTDLLPLLAERAQDEGWRVFFLGGRPGVADRAAQKLRQRCPRLQVAGTASPEWGFEANREKVGALVRQVNAAATDLLVVALGTPKQELWLAENIDSLHCRCAIGVGSALDFISGRKRRAPVWMQRSGLEWLWRLAQEPRRLWRRYLLDDLTFLPLAWREFRNARAVAPAFSAVGADARNRKDESGEFSSLSIAVVTPGYPPDPGGAELQAQMTARELSSYVGRLEVVTTRRRGTPRRTTEGAAVVKRLRTVDSGLLRRPTNFLAALWFFALHPRRYNVLHLFCLSPFTLGAMVAARLTGKKTVVRVSTTGPDGEIAKVLRVPGGRLFWRIFCSADRFIGQRPSLQEDHVGWDVPKDRIEMIPNALRLMPESPPTEDRRRAARAELGLPQRTTVLCLGRLAPEKRVELLLDAWMDVAPCCDATLVIAGNGPEKASIRRRVDEQFPDGSVKLLGWRDNPTSLFEAADICVVTSRAESFCNVLAEAMVFGDAVVSTRVGLARDWVDNCVHGLVVDSDDAGEIAACIIRLVRDGEYRRKLGNAGRQRIQEKLGSERWTKRHLNLYRELTDTQSAPPGVRDRHA